MVFGFGVNIWFSCGWEGCFDGSGGGEEVVEGG